MNLSVGFLLAALAAGAHAHATVWGVWVNDVFQGDGRNIYIRSPPNNNPVKDVRSNAIYCNVRNSAVPQSVFVKAGDKYTVEWYHDNRNDDIIDDSHKGPHTFYIAPASSNGNGAVWTKIGQEGLSGGVWAVDRIISNQGKVSVTIPGWVAPGDYLIRAEIIALHEAESNYLSNSARGAQFYPSCAQVRVTSGGSVTPAQNFNFVGGYSATDPGILFDLYSSPSSYPIPGPVVWSPSGGTNPPTNPPSGTVDKWGQCGGTGYSGPTQCVTGSACKVVNDYYHQCQ